jgi:hypothetical protein
MDQLLNGEYRILSFDPGSYSLGMAVQRLNVETMTLTVLHAETFKVDRYIDKESFECVVHSERTARLNAISRYVIQCCETWGPASCAIELPYMGSMASAYGSLKEVVLTLRNAFITWNPSRSPFFYEPSVIKKAANVSGKSGDKTLMTNAIKTSTIIDLGDINLDTLDEHTIDAILIGHAHLKLGIIKKEAVNEKTKTKRASKTK